MKNKKSINKQAIIFIIIAIIIVILICISEAYKKNTNINKPITGIKEFHLETTGIGYTSYDFTCNKQCSDDKGNELSKEQVNKIIKILNKHKVRKWNGFQKKNDNYWSDASGFKLNIVLDDNSSITASGVMAYPEEYDDFGKEIGEQLK